MTPRPVSASLWRDCGLPRAFCRAAIGRRAAPQAHADAGPSFPTTTRPSGAQAPWSGSWTSRREHRRGRYPRGSAPQVIAALTRRAASSVDAREPRRRRARLAGRDARASCSQLGKELGDVDGRGRVSAARSKYRQLRVGGCAAHAAARSRLRSGSIVFLGLPATFDRNPGATSSKARGRATSSTSTTTTTTLASARSNLWSRDASRSGRDRLRPGCLAAGVEPDAARSRRRSTSASSPTPASSCTRTRACART